MTSERQSRDPGRGGLRTALGWAAALAILALPLLGLRGVGAIEMFLEIEGEISGESMDKDYKDAIEILSGSWGVSNSGSFHVGGGGGAGKANFSDVGFTKWADKSSPILMLYCANGDHFPKAKLTFVEATSESRRKVVEMDFEKVLITSYTMGGSGGDARLSDSFSINFAEFKSTTFSYGTDGSKGGEGYVEWNIVENTGSGSSSGGGGGNTAPSISDVGNRSIDEDGSVTVTFTVGDAQTAAGALSVTAGSNNPFLLPPSRITLGGSGSARTALLKPMPDESGTAEVTLTVTDGGGLRRSDTFLLLVNAVNDAPSISPVPGQVTDQDTSLALDVTLADIDTNLDSVTLTGSATPSGLVQSITDTTGSGTVRTVRLVPMAGASGTATVTLTAADGASGEGQASFSFTINAASGGPTGILVNGSGPANIISLPENSVAGTEIGTLDASDGAGIAHRFSIVSPSGAFVIGGAGNDRLLVGDPSLLDFEASPVLSVIIEAVDATDPLRTRTDSFTIDLSNVNEAALITAPAGFPDTEPETDTVLEGVSISDPDAGGQDVQFTVSAADCSVTIDDAGPLAGKVVGNGTGSVTVTVSLTDLNTVLAAGGLTLRADPGVEGTVTVEFSTDDGGNTGSGGPQTDLVTSTIEIVLSQWEEWRRVHFDAAELADPQVSGFAADCDGDGLPNGGEYGLGTRPKDPAHGPGVVGAAEWDGDGVGYPSISFRRRVGDPDFTIEVQVATDLQGWSGPSATTEISTTLIDGDFEQVLVRSNSPLTAAPKQQMRLVFRLGAAPQ